jgi:hypothetical protein
MWHGGNVSTYSTRSNHDVITIRPTYGVEEIAAPIFRKKWMNFVGVIITSGAEEVPLPNYRRPELWRHNPYIWWKGNMSSKRFVTLVLTSEFELMCWRVAYRYCSSVEQEDWREVDLPHISVHFLFSCGIVTSSWFDVETGCPGCVRAFPQFLQVLK